MRSVVPRVLGAFVIVTSFSHSASAQTLDFDCDVPENRFSSISAAIDGPPVMSGIVRMVEMRSGDYLPVAGGRLVSGDGLARLGFQLIARSPSSSKLDIVLNLNSGNNRQSNAVGQIDAENQIPFSLSLAPTGSVSLQVGDQQYTAEFVPMSKSKAMIFCSTGQFEFTELAFTSKDQ